MKEIPVCNDVPLRSPEEIMRLSRMGQSFPSRLSFLPTLLRQLHQESAQVHRVAWNMNSHGYGHAVYSVSMGGYAYSLVAITNDLDDHSRTDRVIAEAWDSSFVLYDGVPDASEIQRLIRDVPRQEASRFTQRELILSRANKSVRLFDHVVECLRRNCQPDEARVIETGYLMRTTAVYGNGKFGIADRDRISDRPCLSGPFMAEMLTVWLIRGFSHDLAEFLGQSQINRDLKRHIGIGNATGLGMAPFLIGHPVLLNAWVEARETALARVRAILRLSQAEQVRLRQLANRVSRHLHEWNVHDENAQAVTADLSKEWEEFKNFLSDEILSGSRPINALWTVAEKKSIPLQELTAAFLIEPFGSLVDDLSMQMATSDAWYFDPSMPTQTLGEILLRDWQWALDLDFSNPERKKQFWYISETKLEPRLGLRFEEAGAEVELPLDIAQRVQSMALDLFDFPGGLLKFLQQYPHHRSAVRRVQTLMRYRYSEIRDNLIDGACKPIDMLRFKLAFLGAAKFDPKSDLWTRVTLAQGAPLFDELDGESDWWLPALNP
ncbi:MAG: hypothetical protein OXF73_08515 [Gammaproteobacteria bacterium]|nr:hypothetical protein [Gammaproteobacteria bacterium]